MVVINTDDQQRLMGASLLVFKNKSDVAASLGEEEIRQVRLSHPAHHTKQLARSADFCTGTAARQHQDASLENHLVQRGHGAGPDRGSRLGGTRREGAAVLILASEHETSARCSFG
jgi:hypothetical protein